MDKMTPDSTRRQIDIHETILVLVTMDIAQAIAKYHQQTIGRDKLCRTLQYSSRLLGYILEQRGLLEWAPRFKHLDKNISTSRKVFRLGKSIDFAVAGIKALQVKDNILRTLIVLRRATYVVYYFIDQFTWAARVGLYKSDPKEWSKFQAKFWLTALILGVLRNLYDWITLLAGRKEKVEDEGEVRPKQSIGHRIAQRPEVVVDTMKNAADFLLPLNVMGYVKLNTGLAGLLGLISSLCGVMAVWNPSLKLKPS